jgi:hypothetical protein
VIIALVLTIALAVLASLPYWLPRSVVALRLRGRFFEASSP